MRADRGERRVERAECGAHQRALQEKAGVRDQIAGGEIIGAVEHDVVEGKEREREFRVEPRGERLDHDMRVQPSNRVGGAFDLRPADIGRAVQHLALQIGETHRIVVDHGQFSDTGGGEIQERGRADAAGADHEHASRF